MTFESVKNKGCVQCGEVDILTRDTTLGLIGVSVNDYDSQGIMVNKSLNVKSAKELDGATACVQPGTVTLDRYGVFSRPGILWAGPEHTPDSLQASHNGLWLWLSAFGFAPPAPPSRSAPTSRCCATSNAMTRPPTPRRPSPGTMTAWCWSRPNPPRAAAATGSSPSHGRNPSEAGVAALWHNRARRNDLGSP